ncbi:hypothetical protein ACFYYS_32335 [Streptomyces sp. NPDC002120]|uniref:hypothetical protein n=1 Tax=Streptomyces sp. NPDC002120 TaxID=3364631 RepID=UPI00368159F4
MRADDVQPGIRPTGIASLRPQAPRSRWSFDADPGRFRLAAEALRMRHAGLSDPMQAVESSDIDRLPHQIRAVYGCMPNRPGSLRFLRFLLADDPGAGKTVMPAYLKELLLRGDVQRCLIVAPGGLVERLLVRRRTQAHPPPRTGPAARRDHPALRAHDGDPALRVGGHSRHGRAPRKLN